MFARARDAFEITLIVGSICVFVVINPTNLGATAVFARALCLTIYNPGVNPPLTQIVPMVIKACGCVYAHIHVKFLSKHIEAILKSCKNWQKSLKVKFFALTYR